MKMLAFSIKDRALNAYMTPWFGMTINQAIRMFQDELANSSSPLIKHPDDYDLYQVGEWDDQNGKITPLLDGPTQIAIGKHLKQT